MRILIFMGILFLLTSTGLAFSQNLTPEEVLSAVKSKGSKKAVDEIWASEEQSKQLLRGVSSAKSKWLAAAIALAPGADAGASEELNGAISIALLKEPYQLLPWLKETWWKGTNNVCLFGYDSELPGGVANYVVKLQLALAKHPPKKMEPLRQECLRGLNQTLVDLKTLK